MSTHLIIMKRAKASEAAVCRSWSPNFSVLVHTAIITGGKADKKLSSVETKEHFTSIKDSI